MDTWSFINFGPMVQPGLLLGNGLLLIFGTFCNLVSYLVLVFYSVVKSTGHKESIGKPANFAYQFTELGGVDSES